jgi:hypothetical protein
MDDQPDSSQAQRRLSGSSGSSGGDALTSLYVEIFAVPIEEASNSHPFVFPLPAGVNPNVAAAKNATLRSHYLRATRIPYNATEAKIGGLSPGQDYHFLIFYRNRNSNAGLLISSVPFGVDVEAGVSTVKEKRRYSIRAMSCPRSRSSQEA